MAGLNSVLDGHWNVLLGCEIGDTSWHVAGCTRNMQNSSALHRQQALDWHGTTRQGIMHSVQDKIGCQIH
jgi:hypothetical protein